MKPDGFGNLMEWGEVLQKLERLRDSKSLDRHQGGLIRILRYPDNWRLREAALGVIREINTPTEELLKETLNIILNEEIYIEARAMAVDTLALLMVKGGKIRSKNEVAVRTGVLKKMEALMADTHSPLLRDGIERFFRTLAERKVKTGSRS